MCIRDRLGIFNPGAREELVATVSLPGPETGNEYQGATATVLWTFTAQSSGCLLYTSIVEGKTYWMKYTVTMKDEAEPGTPYPTNGSTSIDYTNIDDESAKKYFQPIPEYRIRGVTFTKVLDDPKYADKEFSLSLIHI